MTISDPIAVRDPLRASRNRLLERIAAPAIEPVTLSEAKLYLRVDAVSEDSLIGDLIVAARMVAENWLKRSLVTQSWKLSYDYGIPESVWLPMGPVISIESVTTIDNEDNSAVVDEGIYWLNAARNGLVMDGSLSGFRVDITYEAGYGDADDVPKPIKLGMLAHIASMYDSRGENGVMLPEQSAALYMPFREVRL